MSYKDYIQKIAISHIATNSRSRYREDYVATPSEQPNVFKLDEESECGGVNEEDLPWYSDYVRRGGLDAR